MSKDFEPKEPLPVQEAVAAAEEEDRLDFDLLMRKVSASPSPAAPLNSDHQVWPLHLTTVTVDNYVLGDVIGNGAYAEVRECINTRNLERCAAKIVNKRYLERQAPSALSNQMQEIRLLRRLQHINIVSMRECLLKGSKIYIILEYCPFVLSDLLAKQESNRLPAPLARDLFRQLLKGLEYLHSIGIVHRDIKPQNLLISTCGVLKIIDFGVSQILSLWLENDICSNYEGSPLFQAPEVVSGQKQYGGFKVDAWSAGITLYLLIYGRYPFEDEALLGLYDKILSEPLDIPTDLIVPNKEVLADLLASLLEKEAAKRFGVGEALKHPWLELRRDIVNLHEDEHSEFIELTHHFYSQTRSSASKQIEKEPSTSVRWREKDIYLSMSVLPYLYSRHFSPSLSIVKATRSKSASSSSANSRSSSPSTSSSATSSVALNPHEMIEEREIEWGTEAQYNLLKLPQVRTNRIRKRAKNMRRRRRQST